MPFPELARSSEPLRDSDADALILVLPPLGGPAAAELSGWPGLESALTAIGFTGAAGSVSRVSAPESTSSPLAVVGTGPSPDAGAYRDAAGAAIRTITGFATVAVGAPGASGEQLRATAEGAGLGGYWFEGYKTGAAPKRRASSPASRPRRSASWSTTSIAGIRSSPLGRSRPRSVGRSSCAMRRGRSSRRFASRDRAERRRGRSDATGSRFARS